MEADRDAAKTRQAKLIVSDVNRVQEIGHEARLAGIPAHKSPLHLRKQHGFDSSRTHSEPISTPIPNQYLTLYL